MTVCQLHFSPGTTVLYWLALGIDGQVYRNPRESKIRLSLVQLKWNQLSTCWTCSECTPVKTKEYFGIEFLWLEAAIALWTPLSVEGKPHLRVPMVSLCNIPCPVFSLIAELLLFRSNDFDFLFIQIYREKSIAWLPAQSVKLVLLKAATPSLEMGLLEKSEAARWLNSLTSQAWVEEKQYTRERQTNPQTGGRRERGKERGKTKRERRDGGKTARERQREISTLKKNIPDFKIPNFC